MGTDGTTPERRAGDQRRFSLVREYADRVLDVGRDHWSGKGTPLFVDGVNVDTCEPVRWRYDGEAFVLSNLASQQNLFRVLAGVSALADDPTYRCAAESAVAYHFRHLVDEGGLLPWGGHQFVDLRTLEPVGRFDADVHEFKCHYPFYELLWAVDPDATRRFLRAVWDAHVLDWSTLDVNRHGEYGEREGAPWGESVADPEPFFEGDGLSFVNVGSDLLYAAAALYTLGGEAAAWRWGRRLARLYVEARHPETGLGTYQYSKPRRRREPPESGPLTGELTTSTYGDRAENQFGDQFGDVAREGWVLWGGKVRTIYVRNGLAHLDIAERLGEEGEELLGWTADGLEALAAHGYDPAENAFRPMWADGTDLTGRTYDRTGYYGEAGTTWKPNPADAEFLLTYARAHRLTGRDTLWKAARRIASGLDIGDIGETSGEAVSLRVNAPGDSPQEVFAMLELYWSGRHPAYLERARRVADRLIERRYHGGFFLPSEEHVHARFDAIEPLAILALDATLRGAPGSVPRYVGGSGYVHGTYDGHGRTRDDDVIWSVTRE